jgi:hypothetical protein
MFGSSMGETQVVDVWVRVQIGDEPGSQVKLRVASNIYVADFKEKVKKEKSKDLAHLDADELTVS